MNWDQIEGKWKQYRGALQEKWGRLTNDDLDQIQGKKERLEGKLQEHYGIGREKAQAEIEEFTKEAEQHGASWLNQGREMLSQGLDAVQGEAAHQWAMLQGNWTQYKGVARQKWGKLTDDDIQQISGKKEELVGKLQKRYELTRKEAEVEAESFANSLS